MKVYILGKIHNIVNTKKRTADNVVAFSSIDNFYIYP